VSDAIDSVEVRHTSAGAIRVIVRHGSASVTVWDPRARARLVHHTKEEIMTIPQLRQAWDITSVCWASRDADAYMTGHQSGLVCHWRFTDGAAPQFCGIFEVRRVTATQAAQAGAPALRACGGCSSACAEQGCAQVCDDRVRDPVHSLAYVLGEEPSLLVLGGNKRDLPSSLSLISVPHPDLPEEPDVRSQPACGG